MSYPDNFVGLPDDQPKPFNPLNRFRNGRDWDYSELEKADLAEKLIDNASKTIGAAVFLMLGSKAGEHAEASVRETALDQLHEIMPDLEEARECIG